jgi:hypothetical protein
MIGEPLFHNDLQVHRFYQMRMDAFVNIYRDARGVQFCGPVRWLTDEASDRNPYLPTAYRINIKWRQ